MQFVLISFNHDASSLLPISSQTFFAISTNFFFRKQFLFQFFFCFLLGKKRWKTKRDLTSSRWIFPSYPLITFAGISAGVCVGHYGCVLFWTCICAENCISFYANYFWCGRIFNKIILPFILPLISTVSVNRSKERKI